MRYRKGSIALSSTRDYPLLRQTLHSDLITHNQLFEFSKLDYYVSSRNAFNNRVLRSVKHGLLFRHEELFVGEAELAAQGDVPLRGSEAAESIASEIALRGGRYRHGERCGLMTLPPLSRFPQHSATSGCGECKLVR